MAETTETLFTVARGTEVLTDLRRNESAARGDLAAIEGAMRSAKLQPDVKLATVTRTITVTDPVEYVDQAVAVDEPVVEEQADEQAATTEAKADAKKSGR